MTNGVTITIDMTIRPELAEAVCSGIPAMIAETPQFTGFRSILVVRHAQQANRVLIVEQWDSEGDYQAYQAWRNRDGGVDSAKAHLLAITTDIWPILIGTA